VNEEELKHFLSTRTGRLLHIIKDYAPEYWEGIKDSNVNMDITISHIETVAMKMQQEIEVLQDEVQTLIKDVEMWQERVDDLCESYSYLGDE
jgi:peptidoglycan hydrolase CwlO-like protein